MSSEQVEPLGVVVIGQSPRPAIVSELRHYLNPALPLDLRGALDKLSRPEIDAMEPVNSQDTLFTRLPDGSAAVISKKQVCAGAEEILAEMAADGIKAAMMCCTGAFPPIASPIPILYPSELIRALAEAALPTGRLALVTPLASQFEQAYEKWSRPGVTLEVFDLVPELAPGEEVTALARKLAEFRPDLVVLDCMSYREATRRLLRQTLSVPIILAISATARILEELSV